MRIALLANPDSVHTRRWVRFLSERGHVLLLIADPHTTHRPEGAETVVPRWGAISNAVAFGLTPRPHGNALWKFLHYRPLIRRFAPDVVHGFEAYYSGLATALAGPYARVLTPWGKDVEHDADKGPVWRTIIGQSLRRSDRISTNDETLTDLLVHKFDVDRRKIACFSWGADPKLFHPGLDAEAVAWRDRLEIPPDAPVIFSPRRFDPYWGADLLMDAVPTVARENPGAVFVILAGFADEPFLESGIRKLKDAGLEPRVRWIREAVSPGAMGALFNMSDVFVSLPRTDLLASTVIEGMACGCYPILSDLPAYARHAPLAAAGGRNSRIVFERTGRAVAEAILQSVSPEFAAQRRAAGEFNASRMAMLEDANVNMARMERVYSDAIKARFDRNVSEAEAGT